MYPAFGQSKLVFQENERFLRYHKYPVERHGKYEHPPGGPPLEVEAVLNGKLPSYLTVFKAEVRVS